MIAAFAVAGCGDDDDDDGGGGGSETTAEDRSSVGRDPVKNDTNAATKITIGSKNFTEQKILGEIYAQALAAAGYDVTTELNLGDEKTALKALEEGDISAYPEYTGTALLSFFGVQRRQAPKRRGQGLRTGEGGLREEGPDGAPTDAVRELERGRR